MPGVLKSLKEHFLDLWVKAEDLPSSLSYSVLSQVVEEHSAFYDEVSTIIVKVQNFSPTVRNQIYDSLRKLYETHSDVFINFEIIDIGVNEKFLFELEEEEIQKLKLENTRNPLKLD